jgi:light-regulated signal transduction histidine kinase (bacteriophytochrome)
VLPELVLVAALSITAVGTAATGFALSHDDGAADEIHVRAPAPERWLPEAVAIYGAVAAIGLYSGARREARKAQRTERAAQERSRLFREMEVANRALVRSHGELERIAYAASHEMRAPLRGITNLADWIEDDLGQGQLDSARGHLDHLRERAAQLDRIVHGLQRLARAARTQQVVRFDAGAVVAEALAEVPAREGVRFVVDDAPPIDGDPDTFREVVAELAENAVRHGGRDDLTVRIRVQVTPSGTELLVSDDGRGLEVALHERVWALFETARGRADGSGVGLARVRKLVESAGGQAWVESEPGAGATFCCAWPRADAA